MLATELLNPCKPNGFSHYYQLDQSFSVIRVVGNSFSFLFFNAQVTHSRTGRRISHGYNPASFLAIRIGP